MESVIENIVIFMGLFGTQTKSFGEAENRLECSLTFYCAFIWRRSSVLCINLHPGTISAT